MRSYCEIFNDLVKESAQLCIICLGVNVPSRHWKELGMNSLWQDETFMSFEFQQLINYELDVISVSDYV